MIIRRAVILCCLAATLTVGCGSTPVADDVAQREANEIVAVLSKNNIQAQLVKGRGAKGRYSVVVQEGDFPTAAEVLSRLGLPADKRPSFQELTGGNGIIPPSREVEALRLDKAIASELEDIFRARSDVASASVLVRMHSREANERPTVTVVVQSSGASPLDVAEIREISRRSIPGIQVDDVYVSVAQAVSPLDRSAVPQVSLVPFLGFWKVPAEDHTGLVVLVVFLVGLSGVLAGLAGYIVGQFNWLNKQGMASVSRYLRGGGLGGGALVQGNSSAKSRQAKTQGGDGEEEV